MTDQLANQYRPDQCPPGAGNAIDNETAAWSAIGAGKNSFTNTGTLTVGGASSGTLTLSDDLVTNATGVITVANNGTLDLTGGDTINDGQLNNNGGQINVTGADTIENETGLVTIGAGKNSFTNTGTLTVGWAIVPGTLTLSDDAVTNATGVITVANNGTLDLTGGDAHRSMTAGVQQQCAARSMSPATGTIENDNRAGHDRRRQEQLHQHRRHADGWRGVVGHADAVRTTP